MKQKLTESFKDKQSTLTSALAKKENFIEELRKEIEVRMYIIVYNYICSYIATCIQ